MRKIKNKKSNVNQIFVYAFSFIIIGFVGFLTMKFIFSFLSDTDKIYENRFLENLEFDYKKVYRSYGSENIEEYKFSNNIHSICFFSSGFKDYEALYILPNIIKISNDEIKTIFDNNLEINGLIFDENGLLDSFYFGELFILNKDGFFCSQIENKKIKLVIENIDNKVYISQIN